MTAKVLHDVHCPVMTGVHLEGEPHSMNSTLSNIVCAIDLRQCSLATLGWASMLASDMQANLSVVHVYLKEAIAFIGDLPR